MTATGSDLLGAIVAAARTRVAHAASETAAADLERRANAAPAHPTDHGEALMAERRLDRSVPPMAGKIVGEGSACGPRARWECSRARPRNG